MSFRSCVESLVGCRSSARCWSGSRVRTPGLSPRPEASTPRTEAGGQRSGQSSWSRHWSGERFDRTDSLSSIYLPAAGHTHGVESVKPCNLAPNTRNTDIIVAVGDVLEGGGSWQRSPRYRGEVEAETLTLGLVRICQVADKCPGSVLGNGGAECRVTSTANASARQMTCATLEAHHREVSRCRRSERKCSGT
jgi:hypothetical protein